MTDRCKSLLLATLLVGMAHEAVAQSAGNASAGNASAGTVENIGTVSGSASGPSVSLSAPQTAAQFAPSRVPLDETEPTSVIGQETLQKIAVPDVNYNDVVTLTPSAMDIAPVGPGLQQDFGQSIRGLQYTEFSVLFDGIPVPGFPFNLAPQPGIYFLGRDLSSVTVNRGPGPASAIGPATFGGSVAETSLNPSATPGMQLYGTFGSFATRFYGVQGDTGDIARLDGARITLDLTREESGGALSGTGTERRNLFLKYMQPIGTSTVLTAVVNLDNAVTKTPYGATLADIDAFGRNYALNSDPTSQSFRGYNTDDYTTDFEYIGIRSALGGGWTLDNKVYRTEYIQRDRHGLDPDGTAPNLQGEVFIDGKPIDATGDVPGLLGHFDYGDWGDLLRITDKTSLGNFNSGFWIDRQGLTFYQYDADLSRGALAYGTAPGASPYTGLFFAPTLIVQPYAEFAWKATPKLTVTAGIKVDSVTRSLTGADGLDGAPSNFHATYTHPLPSVDANYRIRSDWSVYAQAAQGFLEPELNLFSTAAPESVQPSTTWSFQTGTVFQRPWINADADLYYILFDNYINSNTVGGETTFFNEGGAVFKGLELEGTVKLGHGLAVYANGTLNDSSYDANGNNLAQTPRRTAAAALLFDRAVGLRPDDDLFANLIEKVVGPQYGLDTATRGAADQFPIKTWHELDATVGYSFTAAGRKLKAQVSATNLTNNQSLTGYGGQTLEGQPLYWVHAGRGVFFSFNTNLL